jgi:hypothetical protein
MLHPPNWMKRCSTWKDRRKELQHAVSSRHPSLPPLTCVAKNPGIRVGIKCCPRISHAGGLQLEVIHEVCTFAANSAQLPAGNKGRECVHDLAGSNAYLDMNVDIYDR